MKRLLLVVAVFSLLFISTVYAGGVTDSNNGNKGDIFVSTGENQGVNSVGVWTNPSFLKVDTGATGQVGMTGQGTELGIPFVMFFIALVLMLIIIIKDMLKELINEN